MQSVFLCMENPYARPDASGYHRRMVVYKCALPEKEYHPEERSEEGSQSKTMMYSILRSEILRLRLRMTFSCFYPAERKALSDSCYHSFTAERSSHSYSVVAFENHPFQNSASDTIPGSLSDRSRAIGFFFVPENIASLKKCQKQKKSPRTMRRSPSRAAGAVPASDW